jgi:hypothetical protein
MFSERWIGIPGVGIFLLFHAQVVAVTLEYICYNHCTHTSWLEYQNKMFYVENNDWSDMICVNICAAAWPTANVPN